MHTCMYIHDACIGQTRPLGPDEMKLIASASPDRGPQVTNTHTHWVTHIHTGMADSTPNLVHVPIPQASKDHSC